MREPMFQSLISPWTPACAWPQISCLFSVSYTHLDVYKRQVQTCLVDAIDGELAIARSKADAPEIDGLVQIQEGREAGLRPGEFVQVRIMGLSLIHI